MATIYKYPLKVQGIQTLSLPKGAKILTVQRQVNELMLWAMVNPNAAYQEFRHIAVFGTGQPVPDGGYEYIATAQMDGFVWRIFERP